MMWTLVLLVIAPILAGLGTLLIHDRRVVEALQYGQAVILLAAGAHVVAGVGTGEPATVGLLLYTDALSAWLDLVLAVVGTTGTLFALGYLDEQFDRGLISLRRFRQFFYLFDLFLASMLIAVNVGDVALMWIAIEGSTLAAALLIAFERNRAALEAGWKFLILGSVGIALALFGTIILYYTSEHVLGVTSDALRWSELYRIAGSLDPTAIKVAFVFVLIGYGTKAGVAPMHSWLPDAHTEAPTPVSAMLSANMLTVAVYAILRFKAVVDRTVGAAFTGNLMIGLGLLSVAIAAVLRQVDRLLRGRVGPAAIRAQNARPGDWACSADATRGFGHCYRRRGAGWHAPVRAICERGADHHRSVFGTARGGLPVSVAAHACVRHSPVSRAPDGAG